MITQPGETDKFKVSDHIKYLENHLGKGTIDVVIANNSEMPKTIASLAKKEHKELVPIDQKELDKMNIEVISDKLLKVESGYIRHNSLKTSYLIFSYLMDKE
jgi:uncharacterized cofD-like protein